jgi:hypothetical protein
MQNLVCGATLSLNPYFLEAEFRNRIRTGTFNVNGNLPSQDLNRWVRGNFQTEVIPPLKNISPLSLGLGKGPDFFFVC